MSLIAANVVAVVLSTVDPIRAAHGALFVAFEAFSVAVFTVEYAARVWSVVEADGYDAAVTGRLRFVARPLPLVDLLAILPFYLATAGLSIDLRVLRALRLVRLFRLLKLARYSAAVASLGRVFRREREELLLAVFANSLLLVLASSVMYFVEHPHQPEAFPSIPATFYWGMVTLSTVGYGDVAPITPLGRTVAGIIAFLGVGMFALPASILASGFIEEAQTGGDENEPDGGWDYCPHCGEPIREAGDGTPAESGPEADDGDGDEPPD
jgi:voltage-gated potassium channel